MSVNEMRKRIRKVYQSATWQERVDQMPEEQVIAIFYSFLRRGLVKQ